MKTKTQTIDDVREALEHVALWRCETKSDAEHKLAAIQHLVRARPELDNLRLTNMRLNLRELAGLANGAVEQVAEVAPAPVKLVWTVRVRQAFGGCDELGEFVRETDKSFVYRTAAGATKTAKKGAKARHAGFPHPQPHVEPCNSCKEFWNPKACMHGTVGDCERCMSM